MNDEPVMTNKGSTKNIVDTVQCQFLLSFLVSRKTAGYRKRLRDYVLTR